MGRLLNLVTPLHRATTRDYMARMMDEKVHCMLKAKEYEGDYWDGDRRYGYGGYRYIEGRWAPVAQGLIDLHGLKGKVRILDVGCGKGYLLREFQRLLPEADLVGFDISKHGLADAHPDVRVAARDGQEAEFGVLAVGARGRNEDAGEDEHGGEKPHEKRLGRGQRGGSGRALR